MTSRQPHTARQAGFARLPRLLLAAAVVGAASAALAAPGVCDPALMHATNVANHGQRALDSNNYYEITDIASLARFSAMDAAQGAKACRCPAAIEPLDNAASAAARTSTAVNIISIKQYASTIKKGGDAAVAALRACAAK